MGYAQNVPSICLCCLLLTWLKQQECLKLPTTCNCLPHVGKASSQDDSSDVSDLEKFDEAYTDFSALTDGVDPQTLERDGSGHPNDEVPGIDLPGGMKALYSLANCFPFG